MCWRGKETAGQDKGGLCVGEGGGIFNGVARKMSIFSSLLTEKKTTEAFQKCLLHSYNEQGALWKPENSKMELRLW